MIDELKKTFGQQVMSTKPATGGIAVVQPQDLTTACRLVRFARDHQHQIVPVGSRSKLHWVDPPQGPAIEMDMRSCNRIVEYSPNDMTVIVEAGITLAALSKTLSENGQRLTLDPHFADRATIGGIIAANDSGPIRAAFGTARDIVIGMSMIEPDGEVIHSGGKVVKNVAGYDLHKLYISSFGTLGPIATITFKLRPIPEARRIVVLHPVGADDAERMIATTLAGETRPTFIELLNAAMAESLELPGRLTLAMGFEENGDAVRWQTERIHGTLGGEIFSDVDSLTLYHKLCEATVGVETTFKATMLSSKVAAFIQRYDRQPIRMIARAASGIIYGLPSSRLDETTWQDLLEQATTRQGNLQIRGPLPGPFINRFGLQRADGPLTERIQKAFDPQGTFAPERLLGNAS